MVDNGNAGTACIQWGWRDSEVQQAAAQPFDTCSSKMPKPVQQCIAQAFMCACIYTFIQSFAHSFVHACMQSCIQSMNHFFIHLSTHPCVHSTNMRHPLGSGMYSPEQLSCLGCCFGNTSTNNDMGWCVLSQRDCHASYKARLYMQDIMHDEPTIWVALQAAMRSLLHTWHACADSLHSQLIHHQQVFWKPHSSCIFCQLQFQNLVHADFSALIALTSGCSSNIWHPPGLWYLQPRADVPFWVYDALVESSVPALF